MSTPSQIVEAAQTEVGHGCAVFTAHHRLNLRWANSALTTNGDVSTDSLTVIALGTGDAVGAVAAVSGQARTEQDAVDLARAAAHRLAETTPLPDAVPLPDGSISPDWDLPAERAADDLLSPVARTVGAVSVPGRSYGFAERDVSTTYLSTSTGTRYRAVEASDRFEICAKTDDLSRSAWWGQGSLAADANWLGHHLTDRLTAQQRPMDLAPGRHRVILTPSAVADLMLDLTWSAGARDAAEGHSVFSRPGGTRLGEHLTARRLDLFADPRWPDLPTADRVVAESNSSTWSVFDNGLPLSRVDLLAAGRLQNLTASRSTALRFGVPEAILTDNLIMRDADGHGSVDDLVARTEEAVLITCLWYIREVDPETLLLTGLTRDGVYRVRDGRIVGCLPNFRFNASPVDLLSAVVDASRTQPCLPREWADWATRAAMPALTVDGFNLSSASHAH